MDGGEIVARGLVVAGGDGPVLLEAGEEILDQMTGFVERLVERDRIFPSRFRGNDGPLARLGQRLAHAGVGVVGHVGDQRVGGKVGQEGVGALQVGGLARRQQDLRGIALRVDQDVELRAQSAAAAPDGLAVADLGGGFRGFLPVGGLFFSAPALCWWARTMVLSSIAY